MSGDSCQHVCDRLDDWLDGLLDAVERSAIEDHLSRCSSCRDAFHLQQKLASDLFKLGGVADRIASEPAKRVRTITWPRIFMRIAAAIGFAVGITTGTLWYRHRPTAVTDISSSIAIHSSPNEQVNPRALELHMPPEDKRLVVNVESKNPKIHIVWLYETIQKPSEPLNKADSIETSTNG